MVKRALSVDEIFQEVKEYDLVLTAEAPLAEALNSRLEAPRLGHFAITPRRLVYSEEGGSDFRQELFLKLVEEKDLSWRQASYLLRSALDCWQHTGELENVKKYRSGEAVQKVIDTIRETPNPLSAMEEYRIQDKDVAVMNIHQFNELDKSILPEDFDSIEVLTDEEVELPEFRVFESAGMIVSALKQNIERVGPENTGIVMNPDSQYQSLVESMLESEDVPFLTQSDLSENEDLRTVISLLRVGLTRKDVRVKDVRPILDELGFDHSRRNENMLLEEVNGLEEFKEFMNVLGYIQFGEVVEKYREFIGRNISEVEELFEDLNILDEEVSIEKVRDLEYYLESFELAEDKTSEGVLFADPEKVSNVDRPVVFFIGMDAEWIDTRDNRPWRTRETDSGLKDFISLIQSGEEQVFMVRDMEMNEEITPCFYFNDIIEQEFDGFTDLPHTRYKADIRLDESGFEKQETGVDIDPVDTLSQSRLNNFALSPKIYYFQKLVSDADNEDMTKGNLFHDYAEFYINHPDFAEELDDDEIIEFMLDRVSPYADDLELEKLETEFKIGLKNIRNFLERHEVEETDIDGYNKADRDRNEFAEKYDRPITSNATEMSFKNDEFGGKGKVDLILNETHLVDYKSGRKYDAKKVVERSNVDLYDDARWPNFQALMYLAFHRRKVGNQKMKFTFLNFLSNLSDEVDGEAELDDNVVTVKYYPQTFAEAVSGLEIYEMLLKMAGKSSNQRKMLDKLGCPDFREFFREHDIPNEYDKDELTDSEMASEFEKFAKQRIGDYKYVTQGCELTLKRLVEIRKSNYFKEDLDRFEDFLREKIDELNECKEKGFPLEEDPDELPERDLLLKEAGKE